MKKLLSIALLLSSFSFAETVNLNAGWNLIGSSNSVDVSQMAQSDSDISIVWRWHDNQWQAYSADPNIISKLQDYNITTFTMTDPNEGFWVYAVAPTSVELNTTTSTTTTSTTTTYPETTPLGELWGYDWYKMVAFYPGDTRYENGIVQIDTSVKDIALTANKIDGQDSRAQAVGVVDKAKGYQADINLITDNINSKFQALAIAKNINVSQPISNLSTTTDLTFIIFVTVNKNSISVGYEFDDPDGNYNYTSVSSETFTDDLTQLTDKSDITIKVYEENGTFYYDVIDLATNQSLSSGTFTVPVLENFEGFDYVAFRSRVDDRDNDAQISQSFNIVNNFETISQPVSTLTDFESYLTNNNITTLPLTTDMFTNKTVVSEYDNKIEYDNFDATTDNWKSYDMSTGQVVESGSDSWSIADNKILELFDDNNQLSSAIAITSIKNNTINYIGFDTDENSVFNDSSIILNGTITAWQKVDPTTLTSWFDNTTFVSSIDTTQLEKTWKAEDGATITFNADGTLTFTDEDGNKATATVSVNNNIVSCNFSSLGFTVFLLPYNITDTTLDGYLVYAHNDTDGSYDLMKVEEIHATASN